MTQIRLRIHLKDGTRIKATLEDGFVKTRHMLTSQQAAEIAAALTYPHARFALARKKPT